MWQYLDVFGTVIVLLETGTSGGEAAGVRRSVVGGIEVKMPGRGYMRAAVASRMKFYECGGYEGLYGAILVPFGALTAGVDVYSWIGGFAVNRGVQSIICNFNIYVEKVEFIAGGYLMCELEDQGINEGLFE